MNESNYEGQAASREPTDERPLIVCSSLSTNPSWRWFAPRFEQTSWQFFSVAPRNRLERLIKRPALAPWRACWESVRTARRQHAKLIISHDARITYRCAQSARLQKARVPHLAWGFNFTTLPRGLYRRLMASVFADVDRFIAYSSLERSLYADYFRIDPARIDVLLWGVAQPLVEPAATPIESDDYICAVGGNARDYRTLFAAMAQVPEIPLVAVLRPENVAGLDVLSNVRLHFNLPVGKTNNIVAFSRFMVLPTGRMKCSRTLDSTSSPATISGRNTATSGIS